MTVSTWGSTKIMTGVYAKSGVVLNDSMRSFLTRLQLATGYDLVATSGIRTPIDQAKALAQDLNFAVYTGEVGQRLVAEIQANGTSFAEMAHTLTAQVTRGEFLSRHMRGDALDLRVTGYSDGQREHLKTVARGLGAHVVDEGDHIHLERIGTTNMTPAEILALQGPLPEKALTIIPMTLTTKSVLAIVGGFGLVAGITIIAIVYWIRRSGRRLT